VIDVATPSGTEIVVAEELFAAGKCGGTPVVALLPAGAEDAAQPLQELGIDLCLMKPITGAELRRQLETLLVPGTDLRAWSLELGESPDLFPSGLQAPGSKLQAPLRILVADDSPINLEVAAGLLELLGHQAVVVDSGQAALELLERETFDAVFMDIEMPNIDGLTAAKMFREWEHIQGQNVHTPVFAMSAHVLDSFRKACAEAGMDGFISKPVEPDELRQVLQNLG
jgi:two-component system sensor kinase